MKPQYAIGWLLVSLIFVGSWSALDYFPDKPPTVKSGSKPSFTDGNIDAVSLGRMTYEKNCASCHGVNLEGEPNWRTRQDSGRFPAPPHDATGHTWHHSEEVLFNITKYGTGAAIGDPSYQSDMPAYLDILSDGEIRAALAYIKSRWPENIKNRHDLISGEQENTN